MVDALYVDAKGIYPKLLSAEHCWDEKRDARTYDGPGPVVAHPPCGLWINMCAANWARYGRVRPAWYPGGDDGGLFAHALKTVRALGGVLEHPAGSHAWPHLMQSDGAKRPRDRQARLGWMKCGQQEWQCEVWQSAYGHRARKRTWLLYCGKRPPFELDWTRNPGTHQVSWPDKRGKARNKPALSKREASATPEPFARELIRLAEWSRNA